MNRKRAILTSCSIILLCTAILVGITYALFNEKMSFDNHLQAGSLDITLTRTNLKYSSLDEKGYPKEVVIEKDEDFTATNSKDKNIFNIDDSTLIVPGSYFESTMKLTNSGNVAFTYYVSLAFLDKESGTNIADQMLITLTDKEGNLLIEKPMLLSDFPKNGVEFSLLEGEMAADEVSGEFIINVKFLDDSDPEDKVYLKEGALNNDAMAEVAKFDLYIVAVQKTSGSAVSTDSSAETSADTTAETSADTTAESNAETGTESENQ